MKTIQKILALSLATCTGTASFAQLGLGSTTQTAIHATTNTAAVVSSTQAITATTMAATKGSVTAVASKAVDLKVGTGSMLQGTGNAALGTTQSLKNNIKSNADLKAGAGAGVDSKTAIGLNNGSTGLQAGAGGSAHTDAGIEVKGSNVVDKADAAAGKAETAVENKAKTATQVSASVKTETKAAINK